MAGPTEDAAKSGSKAPVVVDLGKKRRKMVRRLRRGTGRLMDQVQATLQELRAAGTIAANVQPVIVVVRERKKKSKLWAL